MRKSAIATTVAVLLMMAASHSWAQVRVGARGGLNFSSLGGEVDLDTRTGFAVDAFAELRLSDYWSIQPEAGYALKGAGFSFIRSDTTVIDRDIAISYLEVSAPVILRPPVRTDLVHPRLYLGPRVSLEVKCSVEFEGDPDLSDSYDCDEAVQVDPGAENPEFAFTETKSTDVGLIFGAGLDLGRGPGRVSIDARYDFGLTNIHDVAVGQEIKNRGFQILVGYSFRI